MRNDHIFTVGEVKVGIWSIAASIVIVGLLLLAGALMRPSLGLYDSDLTPSLPGVIEATPLA